MDSKSSFDYEVVSVQGNRPTMEDREVVVQIPSIKGYFLGLFDGHGGSYVSHLAKINLPNIFQWKLRSMNKRTTYATLLVEAGLDFDKKLFTINPNFTMTGTTSLMAVITPTEVHLANCGDSRGILFTEKGEILGRTLDHKPTNRNESHRILHSEGFVLYGRVNGTLSVSRGFGDFKDGLKVRKGEYLGVKGPFSPLADGYTFPRTPGTYLLMACDGLWDVMSSEEVATWIVKKLVSTNMKETLQQLVQMAIDEKRSQDNITVILSRL